jgi:hypothetical protein
MKKLDMILIALYLCISIGAAIYFTVDGLKVHEGKTEAVISVQNEEYERVQLPVAEKREIVIETDLGHNVIEIEGDMVWMHSSDCDDQICVHQGQIHKPKEMIVCLPNELLIEIKGAEKPVVDQIAQ